MVCLAQQGSHMHWRNFQAGPESESFPPVAWPQNQTWSTHFQAFKDFGLRMFIKLQKGPQSRIRGIVHLEMGLQPHLPLLSSGPEMALEKQQET